MCAPSVAHWPWPPETLSNTKCCAGRYKPDRRTGGWLLAFAAREFTAAASDLTLRSRRRRHKCATCIAQDVPRQGGSTSAKTEGSEAHYSSDEDLQRALQRVASGLAKSGNIDGSLSLLGSLQREFPSNPHYHVAAANLLAKQGHIGAARQLASEAAAMHPEEPGYVQVCGRSHLPCCTGAPGSLGMASPILQSHA